MITVLNYVVIFCKEVNAFLEFVYLASAGRFAFWYRPE
jgi:hypothetical protein